MKLDKYIRLKLEPMPNLSTKIKYEMNDEFETAASSKIKMSDEPKHTIINERNSDFLKPILL